MRLIIKSPPGQLQAGFLLMQAKNLDRHGSVPPLNDKNTYDMKI